MTNTYNTYVVAFCPDTDEFFTTNERGFFWEGSMAFQSEQEAVQHVLKYPAMYGWIRNHLMEECGQPEKDKIFLVTKASNVKSNVTPVKCYGDYFGYLLPVAKRPDKA